MEIVCVLIFYFIFLRISIKLFLFSTFKILSKSVGNKYKVELQFLLFCEVLVGFSQTVQTTEGSITLSSSIPGQTSRLRVTNWRLTAGMLRSVFKSCVAKSVKNKVKKVEKRRKGWTKRHRRNKNMVERKESEWRKEVGSREGEREKNQTKRKRRKPEGKKEMIKNRWKWSTEMGKNWK